jgi:PAS domain S-box-containing protein
MKTWIVREAEHYAAAVLIVALAMSVIALPVVAEGPGTAALVATLAVFFAALRGGRGPGIFATLLIVVITGAPPLPAWRLLRLALFVAGGVAISFLAGSFHAARARATAILESITDAFYALDRRWRFTYVNRPCQEMLGRREDELLGRSLSEAFPDIEANEFERQFDYAMQKRVAVHFEAKCNSSGQWYETHAYPSDEGVFVYFRDVTERKLSEEALRDADRRKDEFLAMLAHELRNPLSAISNAVQLAKRDDCQVGQDWNQEVLERQVRHLARLIDDLLDVSRVSRGKIELRWQTLDLVAVLRAAVETVRPVIEERKHRLDVALPAVVLPVRGDPTRLEQIAVNLLTNAAKYTASGGRIWLSVGREGKTVFFTVRDSGVGIPPGQISRMFELFAQGDRSLARSEGGLGIGLTLVRSLAEMHGGGVSARSDGPGLGSQFRVWLPLTSGRAEREAQKPTPPPREGVRRILVVDDNHDTARGMCRLLRLLGHEVCSAPDGPSAIEAANAFWPEYVLLDIGLPAMDGYQVARRLREDGHGEAVIIAVSGYGQDEDRRRSREAGIDHHLVKPVDHTALLQLIGDNARVAT